jgi:hypothetical protein
MMVFARAFTSFTLLLCAVASSALAGCGAQSPMIPGVVGGEGGRGASGGKSGGGSDNPGAGGAARSDAGSVDAGSVDLPPADDALIPGTPDGASTQPDAPGPPAGADECARLLRREGPASAWVSWDERGKLVYKPLNPEGDRIMDFSYAGYHNGGVALPVVPVAETVAPSGGVDDTAAIQAAIDRVAQRPLVNGFRGAVLLGPGIFKSATTVTISASGVVLRGSGSGQGGGVMTEVQLTGTPHRFLILQGTGTRTVDSASATTITDPHVPVGARTFSVASAAAFKVGDTVLVGRPVTAEWVAFMGMDKLVRNGLPQTWIKPGGVISAERTITAIAGDAVTIDIPINDSYAAVHVKPPGGSLTKFSFPRTSEIGVEHLRVVGQPKSETVNFNFLAINTVVDAWVKDVVAHDVTAGITTNGDAKRITIEDTVISHTMVDYVPAAKPSDFNIDASEVLIHRSASRGANRSFSFVTESGVPGPTVVLNFEVTGVRPPVQPHQRWATGLLVDNANLQSGSIDFIDRNILGSGHGWTIGWGVAWNCSAESFAIQQPPGAMNWAIGCKGQQAAPAAGHPSGTFDSHGAPVNIKSLYLAQLCERLGPQALTNIGY